MVLINLSLLAWTDVLKKRNQSIFTHLLANTDLFERGLYVDPPRIANTAAHGVTSTCSGPGTY